MYSPIVMIVSCAATLAVFAVLILVLLRRFRRLNELVQYYPDPLMSLDENFSLIDCNQAFAHLVGYGSVRECIEFFDEYPHFVDDDYQIIKDTIGMLDAFPSRIEQTIALKQRMGSKVERQVEILSRNANKRTELRLLSPLTIPAFDDLWSHAISIFDVPVVLLDQQDRLVGMNSAADASITDQIGEKFQINTASDKQWTQVPLNGSEYHSLLFLAETNASPPGEGMRSVASNSDEMAEGSVGQWSVNLENGELELSNALLGVLAYDQSELSAGFFWNCIANADKPLILETIKHYETGSASEIRVAFRVANSEGVEHYIEVRGSATQRSASGQLIKLEGTHRLLAPQRAMSEYDKDTLHESAVSQKQTSSQACLPPLVDQHDLANHISVVTGYADLLQADSTLAPETRSFVEAIVTAGRAADKLVREQSRSKKAPEEPAAQSMQSDSRGWESQLTQRFDRLTQYLTTYFDAEANHEGVTEMRDYVVGSNPEYCSVCGEQVERGSHAREVFDGRVRIDQQSLPYITNPAFYGDASGRSGNLAELAQILHQQNGHMSLSADARGVTVTIYSLPKSVTLAASSENRGLGRFPHLGPGSTRQRTGKPRILVVDDEELVSNYLSIVLGRAGYEVTTLNKPQLALRFLNRDHQPCDLLITDQNMPDMTGDQLCESVRSKRPELPMILCTGYHSLQRAPSQSAPLPQSGFVSVLNKPLDTQELLDVVQALIVPAPNEA